ncbi:MAG: hypothetical protein KBC38_00500 [Candidatus Pacebacteria bacterium]|nr:hypothetical protein [Candidatus Paceibacterota bacterium]MBP9840475.1 hypothetical protein [Candidatus Paceibacterota bacterium]
MPEKPAKAPSVSFFKKIVGVLCIIIGLLALITPLTPGSWLIFVGLTLLGITLEVSEDHRFAAWAKRVGIKIKKKVEEVKEDMSEVGK